MTEPLEYPGAIARMFERNLEAVAATLAEPKTEAPARARRVIDLLVETLAGYAYGIVAAQLARATASWFGPAYAPPLRAARVPERRSDRNDHHDVRIARALAHAPLDLGCELRVALAGRLGAAARDVGELVRELVAILPVDRAATTEAMFRALRRDTAFDDRLAIEIAHGWAFACAAIEHRPAPDLAASPRARALWEVWARLAGAPGITPPRDPSRSDGSIVQIR